MAEKSNDFKISDESTNILVSKIHKFEFVDGRYKLRAYSCCECKNVAIRHNIANCEDVFCHACYGQYYQRPCPVCQTVITKSTQDDEFTNAVFKLKVACEYKKNGCPKVVSLSDFLVHVRECRLSTKNLLPKVYKVDPQADILEQQNENFNDIKSVIQDMRAEIRQLKDAMVEMKQTNTKLTTAVTNDFQNNCAAIKDEAKRQEEYFDEMKKVIDGLAAEITLVRQEFQDKLDVCVATTKQSAKVTGNILPLLSQIKTQNENQLVEIRTKVTELLHRPTCISNKQLIRETQLRELEYNSDESLDTTFNWTISGVRNKMTNCRKKYDIFAESEVFSIPSHGLKFTAKLWRDVDESHMCITLKIISESSAGSLPFFHLRKYVMVDQSISDGKQNVLMVDQPCFGQIMTNDYFAYQYLFPICMLEDRYQYTKNDRIVIRIIFEPFALMFHRVLSMDGVLLLRIDNYGKRKQAAIEGIRRRVISEPFYTSAKGFKMDIEIYLNGFDKNEGKGISIHPRFLIGEWDDLHSNPIKFTYCRFLMDQSDASTKRDISYESGVQEFTIDMPYSTIDTISHKDAEKLPYLKDDSLLIKFVIEKA